MAYSNRHFSAKSPLNPVSRNIPHIGGKPFYEIAVVDDGQNRAFKLGQGLLKLAARGDV